MRRRSIAPLLLSLSIGLSSALAHAQSDEDKAAARSLATQGAQALDGKKYAEALDLVQRAEQLVHAPTHLLMIARAQVGLGRYVAAKETYLKLMREELAPKAPDAFKNAQASAKEEVAAIEPKIGQLKVVLEGAGQRKITVKIDDVLIPGALIGVFKPTDPGKHEVVAYPPGLSPVKGMIELKEGEKKDLKLVIPEGPAGPGVPDNPQDNPDQKPKQPPPGDGGNNVKPPPPAETAEPTGFMSPMRGAGIGVGAAGLIGVVVGSIFAAKGFSTSSKADEAFTACTTKPTAGCQQTVTDLDNQAAQEKTIGTIGLVAGGALLVTGAVLLAVGKPKAKEPAKASLFLPSFAPLPERGFITGFKTSF